jgi:hypothetical protein
MTRKEDLQLVDSVLVKPLLVEEPALFLLTSIYKTLIGTFTFALLFVI